MINSFSDYQRKLIEKAAKKDTALASVTQYNKFIELIYEVKSFKLITAPQWSHIQSIERQIDGSYIIVVAIFNDDYFYDLDIALKNGFITIEHE